MPTCDICYCGFPLDKREIQIYRNNKLWNSDCRKIDLIVILDYARQCTLIPVLQNNFRGQFSISCIVGISVQSRRSVDNMYIRHSYIVEIKASRQDYQPLQWRVLWLWYCVIRGTDLSYYDWNVQQVSAIIPARLCQMSSQWKSIWLLVAISKTIL